MNNDNKSTILFKENGVKVLSLFDGMSCGLLAMARAGITISQYDAYEIDKYAIKTSIHNFPMIKQHGDVFEADFTQYENYDYLIGGSPCTYWSIAQKNNRETEASGLGWELFQQYVRALREAKPKYFIYENNKSMSDQIRESINETFGFEAVHINSSLVSAQNRNRLYWVGKRNEDGSYIKVDVELPEDRKIFVKDILDEYFNKTERCVDGAKDPIRVGALPRPNGELSGSQAFRIYDINAKSVTINAGGGGAGGKTGLYACPIDNIGDMQTIKRAIPEIVDKIGYLPEMFNAYNRAEIKDKSPTLSTGSMATSSCATCKFEKTCMFANTCISLYNDCKDKTIYPVKDGYITINGNKYPIKLADGYYIIRKLSVSECKRLQTVPEWYDFSIVSPAQAYKMLGNGWTVDVITHILSYLK